MSLVMMGYIIRENLSLLIFFWAVGAFEIWVKNSPNAQTMQQKKSGVSGFAMPLLVAQIY